MIVLLNRQVWFYDIDSTQKLQTSNKIQQFFIFNLIPAFAKKIVVFQVYHLFLVKYKKNDNINIH